MYFDKKYSKFVAKSQFLAKSQHKNTKSFGNDDEELLQPDIIPGLLSLLSTQGEKKRVFRDYNHIYFRCEVTMDRVDELCNLIEEYNRDHDLDINTKASTAIIIPKPIYLHITSMGGDMLAGFLAYDYIKNSKIPIYTVAEGYAISSAANMFMAGKKRFMTENSYILIHQLNITKYGTETFHDMLDNASNIIEFMSKLYSIYLNNIRHHRQKVNDDDILTKEKLENHMLHDIYWNYNTCLKYGIVDDIYTNYANTDKHDIYDIFRCEGDNEHNIIKKTYTLQELVPSEMIIKKIRKNIENKKNINMADMIKGYLENKQSTDKIDGIVNTNLLKRDNYDVESDENNIDPPIAHRSKRRKLERKNTNKK